MRPPSSTVTAQRLRGGEVRGIDEHEAAIVEGDRPTSARIDDVNVADIDGVPGVLSEILDDDTRSLVGAAGVNPYPIANRESCRYGGVGGFVSA